MAKRTVRNFYPRAKFEYINYVPTYFKFQRNTLHQWPAPTNYGYLTTF